jgi:hypothetical protein
MILLGCLGEKDIKMMVRSKINLRIVITFLIPLKLKANYTIKSLQSEYQYQGIHKSKIEKCPCPLIFHNVRFCSLQCHSYFLVGAAVQSPVALVLGERNAYCQYYSQNL